MSKMAGSPGADRPEKLSLTLESNPVSAEVAESLVVEFSGKAGFDERQCHEIGLAVREAVANAVLHGNRCLIHKQVELAAELCEGGLAVTVGDEGEGFDIDAVPDPLQPGNLMLGSGRGIFLVKALMDAVSVRRSSTNGTELTMIKYLSVKEKQQ